MAGSRTHIEYRVVPPGFPGTLTTGWVDVPRGQHGLLKCDPNGHFDLSYCVERVRLPELRGDPALLAPADPKQYVCEDDVTLPELKEEGFNPATWEPKLAVYVACHEEGRYVYPQYPHTAFGHEWYGPITVYTVSEDEVSGCQFHTDVTPDILTSMPARFDKRSDSAAQAMAAAAAKGIPMVFMR